VLILETQYYYLNHTKKIEDTAGVIKSRQLEKVRQELWQKIKIKSENTKNDEQNTT